MRSFVLLTLSLLCLTCIAISTHACPSPHFNPNDHYKVSSSSVTIYTLDHPTIDAHPGDEFAIRLPSNPTTGYTWLLKDDAIPDELDFLGCRYKRTAQVDNQPALIGGGGSDCWGFRAKENAVADGEKKEIVLQLQKVRPWEQPRSEEVHAEFRVILGSSASSSSSPSSSSSSSKPDSQDNSAD